MKKNHIKIKSKQIGIYGMGPMGRNIARNWAIKGYSVFIANRTVSKAYEFLKQLKKENIKESKNIRVSEDLEQMVKDIPEGPIVLLIPSGDPQEDLMNNNTISPIDEVLFKGSLSILGDGSTKRVKPLVELVNNNHVIIDAGNSHPYGTTIRDLKLSKRGIHFIGMGVSGGELGALKGPSIMPGGAKNTYEIVEAILQDAAAKIKQTVCCEWLGPAGAGHLVKTVHNGIEYSIMAGISEIYWLLKEGISLSNSEIRDFFKEVNQGDFRSYLLDITVQILSEENNNSNILDKILDSASTKGTGKWTVQIASDLGIPVGSIYSALELREISNNKSLRKKLSKNNSIFAVGKKAKNSMQRDNLLRKVSDALRANILTSYIQGFQIIEQASRGLVYTKPHINYLNEEDRIKIGDYSKKELEQKIDLTSVARVWKSGCIIRSNLLEMFEQIFTKNQYQNLLEEKKIQDYLARYHQNWKEIIKLALDLNLPFQTIGSEFNYILANFSEKLPSNMIQAQRDLFGAHTYRRIDKEGTFHHFWGKGYSVTEDYQK